MMRCSHVVELLGELVSAELPASYPDPVNEHLHTCPSCAAMAQSYGKVIELAHRLPPVPLPPGLLQRLRQRVKARSSMHPEAVAVAS